jgi:hypothetical protein
MTRTEVPIVTESSSTLLRTGGYAAFAIIPLLVAAGVAFWLFLNGAGPIFGPINDLLVATCLLLLALPVLAIRALAAGDLGAWFDVLTWLALAGLALAVVGQVLLVIGILPLEGSFVTAWLVMIGWTCLQASDRAAVVVSA